MNIYALIPLIATVAYVPLLITTLSARPWRQQHRLFLYFLIAACSWSLLDIFFRIDLFPGFRVHFVQILIFLFYLVAIQFHAFMSSYYPENEARWLPFAYGSLIVVIVPVALGYLPQSVVVEGGKLMPNYGPWVGLIAIPLVVLVARNLFIFIPGIRHPGNAIKYNQTVSLVLSIGVLAVFLVSAIFPFAKEFPISHLGNIFVAVILSYAVVGQHLFDIRFVLRRSFIWVGVSIIGVAVFWTILLFAHLFAQIQLDFGILLSATVAGVLTFLLINRFRALMTGFLGKALQGESYYYRERLFDFANKIHNIFSLREQGGELLTLLTRSIGCRRAGLLFLDSNGDFEARLTESASKDDPIAAFRLRGDNPVVEYLKRERRPLTRESLAIQPEFLGMWKQENDSIETNHIELFLPLISRDRLIGILILDDKISGHYNLEDYSVLEDITSKVAVSMEKEYLRDQLKEREEELSVINRSNAIITSSLDIQRIYDNFIKELNYVVDVDWAAIAVIEDAEIYFMAISTEIGSPWKVGERLPLKGSGTEWVLAHGKTIIDRDLSAEMLFSSDKYYLQHGVRSIAYLPLLISNQVIGTLIVASRKPDAYSPKQAKLLEQLASQIAMPIENALLYARTERLARIDSLTGLLNRRSLDETLPSEIGRHSRYGGIFSLIILDIDSLKTVNDSYGHLAGDELLRQVGTIIKNTIRESDSAFRYGGDEFAILLPQTGVEAALKVAERIRQQAYARIEIGSTPVSTSLGISSWPADGINQNALIAAADAALYQAKRDGRNRSVCSSALPLPVQKAPFEALPPEGKDAEALSTIFALAATIDSRDMYSHNHARRVHDYAVALGERLGLNALEINRLGTCALLHDIGKIGINDEILHKKEPLTAEDWVLIKSHARLGASIAGHSVQLVPCVLGILHHHEQYNGAGYPDGLKGEDIPLESRILAIADAFTAMTSPRAHSKPLTFEAALQEIKNGAGQQFDPKLVGVFLQVARDTVPVLEETKNGL